MIRTSHLYEDIFSSMCLYSSSSARLSTYLFLPRFVLLLRSITRSGWAPLSRPSDSSQSSSLHLYLTIRDWTCLVNHYENTVITKYLHIISPEPCCKKGKDTLVTIPELQKVFRPLTFLLVVQNSTKIIPDL